MSIVIPFIFLLLSFLAIISILILDHSAFSQSVKLATNLTNDRNIKQNNDQESGLLVLWGAIIGALGAIGGSMVGSLITYYKEMNIKDIENSYIRQIIFLELKYFQDFFKLVEDSSIEDNSNKASKYVQKNVDQIRYQWNSRTQNYQSLPLEMKFRVFKNNSVKLQVTYNNIGKFIFYETPNPLSYQKSELEHLSKSISETLEKLRHGYELT